MDLSEAGAFYAGFLQKYDLSPQERLVLVLAPRGNERIFLGVLELVVMLVAAWGVGRAMGALAKIKFGEKIGYEKLNQWVNNRGNYETTIKSISKRLKYYTQTGEPI